MSFEQSICTVKNFHQQYRSKQKLYFCHSCGFLFSSIECGEKGRKKPNFLRFRKKMRVRIPKKRKTQVWEWRNKVYVLLNEEILLKIVTVWFYCSFFFFFFIYDWIFHGIHFSSLEAASLTAISSIIELLSVIPLGCNKWIRSKNKFNRFYYNNFSCLIRSYRKWYSESFLNISIFKINRSLRQIWYWQRLSEWFIHTIPSKLSINGVFWYTLEWEIKWKTFLNNENPKTEYNLGYDKSICSLY